MVVDDILKAMATVLAMRVANITGSEERKDQFIGYINDAMVTICDYGDWSFLNVRTTITMVADQDYIELPSDFDAFQSNSVPYYNDASSSPFDYAPADVLDTRKRLATSTTGRPLFYTPYFSAGGVEAEPTHKLLTWPTPDDAYPIALPYRRSLPRLSAVSDVPQIPLGMHEVLRALACCEGEEQWEKVAQSSQRPKAMARLINAWARYGTPMRGQAKLMMRSTTDAPRGRADVSNIDPIVVAVS
jgi:hypothetical protein